MTCKDWICKNAGIPARSIELVSEAMPFAVWAWDTANYGLKGYRMDIDHDSALYFRDELRAARAKALRDAEAFDEIIFVVERLGCFLKGEMLALGKYAGCINAQAKKSPLAKKLSQKDSGGIPTKLRGWHTPFWKLYDIVRDGRNTAMHEGVFARYLTERVIELS